MRRVTFTPKSKSRLVHRGRSFRFTGPIGPIYAGGNFPRLLRHIARDRVTFFRFNTTPDWAGLDRAAAGAAAVMSKR